MLEKFFPIAVNILSSYNFRGKNSQFFIWQSTQVNDKKIKITLQIDQNYGAVSIWGSLWQA